MLPMCVFMEDTMADLAPAAQYLRMSTEHQQYSFENQSAAIQKYAESRGFIVIRTYSDAAKSGVQLKHRTGLRQLLKDVVDGAADYRVILSYDVSRWGRFQDTDEAAHYEFLCKSAGIPVHYCAETFANDGSLPSLIMKALKRTMAGEYSRELSVKVAAGQRRIALLGFKQGGMPGYGLRRMLVSPNGTWKQQLGSREYKSLASDRVILVPGPPNEIEVVQKIYSMLIEDGLSVRAIANNLNREGIPYIHSARWEYAAVIGILTHLKYIGCHVFGRTSSILYTPVVKLPKSEWIVISDAFTAIVDYPTFAQAQYILYLRSCLKSEAELLDGLRQLLKREGRLSVSLIARTDWLSSPTTYKVRFGSFQEAYRRIGYGGSRDFGALELRSRTQAFRNELIARIVELFSDEVQVLRRGGRWRPLLRLWKRVTVSVVVVRTVKSLKQTLIWRVDPPKLHRRCITLLARLGAENQAFFDFHVLPNLDRSKRLHIRETGSWLLRGERMRDLSEFCQVVSRVFKARRKRRGRA